MKKVLNTVIIFLAIFLLMGAANPKIARLKEMQAELETNVHHISFLRTVLSTIESEEQETDILKNIYRLRCLNKGLIKEITSLSNEIEVEVEVIENENPEVIESIDEKDEVETIYFVEEEIFIEDEYPKATYCWSFMKNLGWSDAVCAGIMGNIMVEVGGGTFDLVYAEGGSYYYGICQWSPEYCPEVQGACLEDQLWYLANTIAYQLNNYGYLYASWLDYSSFLSLGSPSDAALAFAICYEKCADWSYYPRQSAAMTAYDYFSVG